MDSGCWSLCYNMCCVKRCNWADAAFAGDQIFPGFFYTISNGCDGTHASNHNSSVYVIHIVSSFLIIQGTSNLAFTWQFCRVFSFIYMAIPPCNSFIYIAIPPSTRSTSPVTYLAFTRYATASATSSGSPIFPRGIIFNNGLSSCVSVISVLINPGAIALHRIPRGASSFATYFVKPINPAFDAE